MKFYCKYLVSLTDKFNPDDFPLINDEINVIKIKTAGYPVGFKDEMIISFLKDHSLESDWSRTSPALSDLITSGLLFTGDIESLFESCPANLAFRLDLEKYLRQRLAEQN